MSLSLSIVTFDQVSHEIIADELLNEVAGLESWRNEVYASKEVVLYGAKYLPRLKNEDLLVYGDELENFREEVVILISKVKELAEDLSMHADSLTCRLENIQNAIIKAKQSNKGVFIS